MPLSGSEAKSVPNRRWGYSTAGRVFYGWGVTEELRSVAKEFGRRVMVCGDQNLTASGISGRVEALLKEGGAEVLAFPDGRPDIDLELIEACADAARAFRPNVMVGLGGGSNMDLTKASAVLVAHGGSLSTYYGEHAVPGPIIDIVCIPTTSGTGSEVSPVAVVTDPSRSMKVGIASRRLIPKWAVVDPSLAMTCPAHVTAHSGMDALSHAIEAFCARIPDDRSPQAVFVGKNPVSDALAMQAIKVIARALPTAVHQPSNHKGREDMALGSLLAGMAFSAAGTATVHALQYSVGEATRTSHGHGNAVLMPAVMNAIMRSRIPELAFIGRAFDARLERASDEEAAREAPELVASLGETVGIPRGLASIGLRREQLAELAERSSGVKRLLDNSPVSFDLHGLVGILEEAM